MKLDVIFAADALRPPLTGIGRYTYELARRVRCHEDIERLRYFSSGRWVSDPLGAMETSDHVSISLNRKKAALRDRLAGSRIAVRVYERLAPAIFEWRLRGNEKSVYHSPNYIVPPFKGRTVSTVHDLSHIICPQFHPRARVEYMNMALGDSLARTNHVITVSETVRQEVLAHGLMPPEQVTAIHLAAGSDFFPHSSKMLEPAMTALGLRAGEYSLFVGTVEPRKNVERLVQAYGMLPERMRSDWPLVIAGARGWNSDSIHACIEKAQAQGWARYISYVDQSWLPALYAGARLMAYPSLYEGFGLPIVEALASGTPVLTSRVSCMPEVAGGAAWLVDPLDLEEISHGLEVCLADERWQEQARALGLARSAQFSWEKCAERTVGIYARVAQLV
ncbi:MULTISPECIES: glycosyltransferase family 4 protein [Delftia]|uniref:Glycosyltransferase family 4 protein n=2 Tax=Delftia TaxID=80865 RepID=A0A7T2VZZ7_DELAC|nr:glycosyltransferase family 1 protein [Delftia acidovorans]MBL8358227.1 glycosyltransferase family 4 protein [Delftia acidovorans]QPS07610.1 glycosyltransferase family 4 protein [Delftia acidovorans]